MEKLSESKILTAAQASLQPLQIKIFEEMGSTNQEAFQLAKIGAPEETVIFAEKQTAGRGRLDRKWESPAYKNLYFSIILRPSISPELAPQLTLVAGLALYEALSSLGLKGLRLKWPNDVWIGSKKVAGILTEMEAEAGKVHFVVIGIGLNVNSTLEDFSKEVASLATSLLIETGKEHSRSEIAGKILTSFFNGYRSYLKNGFSVVKPKWEKAAYMKGERVRVSETDRSFVGICEGLDEMGALLVKSDSQVERVITGDVGLCS
jgi:BirA family biotin operon repressor/biotin-[acetyl-CoA-carboxylase] ligase